MPAGSLALVAPDERLHESYLAALDELAAEANGGVLEDVRNGKLRFWVRTTT